MATKMPAGLKISPDYTEDNVGFALESLLSLVSFPRRRYSLEPFSRGTERWLGADARLEGNVKSFKPFYMQFKRPYAYPARSTSKIIQDRLSLKLQVDPHALFFELHDKKASHSDFQHNVLFRLRRRLLKYGLGDAAYVCPLFLERAMYRRKLHFSGLRLWTRFWMTHPWELEDLFVNSAAPAGAINLSAVPLLKDHITIPPHALVTSAKHSYSFTPTGRQVCFHSPMALPGEPVGLGQFLSKVAGRIDAQDGFVSAESSREMLERFLGHDEIDGESLGLGFELKGREGVAAWRQFGLYLRRKYGIEQYAFVNWKERPRA